MQFTYNCSGTIFNKATLNSFKNSTAVEKNISISSELTVSDIILRDISKHKLSCRIRIITINIRKSKWRENNSDDKHNNSSSQERRSANSTE